MFQLDRDFVDQNIELSEAEIELLTQQAAEGTITVEQWQDGMETIVYNLLIATAALARDGENDLAIWTLTGAYLQEQYAYLANFATEIANGRYPTLESIGAVIARAKQYAQAARILFEKIRREVQRTKGITQKRRVLRPADHCPDCVEQSALDWVDINDPRVTDLGVGVRCGMNDKCLIEYR